MIISNLAFLTPEIAYYLEVLLFSKVEKLRKFVKGTPRVLNSL